MYSRSTSDSFFGEYCFSKRGLLNGYFPETSFISDCSIQIHWIDIVHVVKFLIFAAHTTDKGVVAGANAGMN